LSPNEFASRESECIAIGRMLGALIKARSTSN